MIVAEPCSASYFWIYDKSMTRSRYTVAAIQVADVCLALLGMYTPPVGLTVVTVGILRIVLLHDRLKVVLTCTGSEKRYAKY